jgi:Putative zinc-finger
MTDAWTSKLSEYLDDELSGSDRQALEAHLATCAACGRTLDELRRVVSRAGSLDDRPPAKDLWSGVARRIGVRVPSTEVDLTERREQRRRRLAFSIPQLAAAALVLVMASGAGMWALLQNGGRLSAVGDQPNAERRSLTASISWVDSTQRSFDVSLTQLRETLESGRNHLDTATVRILEENLRTIDAAIAQARTALAADPGSAYLSQHLAKTMRTKLELLQRAQSIAQRS